jgi:hypothetical protein
LASRPAPRPRTIHAMMPITGSLVSPQVKYAVIGQAGQIAVGDRVSRGCSPSFSRSALPAPVRVRIKKSGPCRCPRNIGGCLGPERCLYPTLPRRARIGIPPPIATSPSLTAQHSSRPGPARPGQGRPACTARRPASQRACVGGSGFHRPPRRRHSTNEAAPPMRMSNTITTVRVMIPTVLSSTAG